MFKKIIGIVLVLAFLSTAPVIAENYKVMVFKSSNLNTMVLSVNKFLSKKEIKVVNVDYEMQSANGYSINHSCFILYIEKEND